MSKLTLSASVAALLMAAPALAADMNGVGGNCCADLEERVAELEATAARKDNRKVSLTVYGSVNYGILHVTADGYDETTITNNPNAQSRIGFKGDATINADWSAGFVVEIGLGEADEPEIFAGNPQVVGDGILNDALVIRHSALYLKHSQLGAFWLGKTSTATDGIAEISIANVANASTLLSLEPVSSTYLGGLNLPFDGVRTDVVKWVSPTFGGFTASAAWMGNDSDSDDAWDVALRYAGEGGGFKFAAGVGYRKQDTDYDSGVEVISGSASVMHVASGLFVNAAAGKMEGEYISDFWAHKKGKHRHWFALDDMRAVHVQGGIEKNFFGFGNTTLYGEWARVEFKSTETSCWRWECDVPDEVNTSHSSTSTDFWGLGVNQSIDAAAMDLYVGYRNYEDFDMQTVIGGAIIRF